MLQNHQKKIFLTYIVAVIFVFTVVVRFITQNNQEFLQKPPISVTTLFEVSSPFFEEIQDIQEFNDYVERSST